MVVVVVVIVIVVVVVVVKCDKLYHNQTFLCGCGRGGGDVIALFKVIMEVVMVMMVVVLMFLIYILYISPHKYVHDKSTCNDRESNYTDQ